MLTCEQGGSCRPEIPTPNQPMTIALDRPPQANPDAELPPSFSAADLSKLLGVSDRTIRNWRKDLEWVYYWAVDRLKAADGGYSQHCYTLLMEYQSQVTSGIPMRDKNGHLKFDRKSGRAKLKRQKPPKTLQQYAETVWQKHRQPANAVPYITPETPTEISEAITAEILDQDEPASTNELESVALVFTAPQQGLEVVYLNNVSEIAADTQSSFNSFRKARLARITQQAAVDGAEDACLYAATYQKVHNQALETMMNVGQVEPEPPKEVKRSTRKKG